MITTIGRIFVGSVVSRKPPLCKGRWPAARRVGGIAQQDITNSHSLPANSLPADEILFSHVGLLCFRISHLFEKGIACKQHRYMHRPRGSCVWPRCWESAEHEVHSLPERLCALHPCFCSLFHSAASHPARSPALLRHYKSRQYTFPAPSVGKNGPDKTEENHTTNAVLPWSFLFAIALRMEPVAYYASTAPQSLRHGLRRATSLYTMEAWALPRQIIIQGFAGLYRQVFSFTPARAPNPFAGWFSRDRPPGNRGCFCHPGGT